MTLGAGGGQRERRARSYLCPLLWPYDAYEGVQRADLDDLILLPTLLLQRNEEVKSAGKQNSLPAGG